MSTIGRRSDLAHRGAVWTLVQLIAVAAALTLLGASGCKKSGEDADTAGAAAAQKARHARGLYAKGFNQLIDDPNQMIKDFFKSIPERSTAAGKGVSLYPRHTSAAPDINTAKEAFTQAAAVGAQDVKHLQPIAAQTLGAADDVRALYEQAHQYYTAEDFKDDAGKKGQQLFDQMKQASAVFRQSLGKFADALSALEDQETLAEIKRYEAKKGPSYWFRYFNLQAKKTLDATRTKESFAKAFATLEGVHQQLDAWRKKQTKIDAGFEAYLNGTSAYYLQAKKLKRRLSEGPSGDVAQQNRLLVDRYNILVSSTNGLYKLEAAGLL